MAFFFSLDCYFHLLGWSRKQEDETFFFLVVRVIAALLAKKKQEVCPKEVLNAAVETTESSRSKTTTKLLFPSSLFLWSESESFFLSCCFVAGTALRSKRCLCCQIPILKTQFVLF